MQLAQPPIPTAITLNVTFEDAVLSVSFKHDAPVHLASRLGYRMRPDEARNLAAELVAWADAQR